MKLFNEINKLTGHRLTIYGKDIVWEIDGIDTQFISTEYFEKYAHLLKEDLELADDLNDVRTDWHFLDYYNTELA